MQCYVLVIKSDVIVFNINLNYLGSQANSYFDQQVPIPVSSSILRVSRFSSSDQDFGEAFCVRRSVCGRANRRQIFATLRPNLKTLRKCKNSRKYKVQVHIHNILNLKS